MDGYNPYNRQKAKDKESGGRLNEKKKNRSVCP
jgi:hypothetical protein